MTNKKQYDNSSITSLKGADRVRLKPAVIFGSDGLEGAKHTLFEIFSNSVDEAKSGYGDTITVSVHSDNSLTIEDRGRGIPLDWNEKEQRYNWELCCCELYAGGKYNIDDDEDYDIGTLGTNGLGLASSQYASEFMHVTSYRDGYKYEMHFAHGEPVGELIKEALPKDKALKTGTIIHYKPDNQVFTEVNIPFEWLKEMMNEQAVIAKGIHFQLGYAEADNMVEFYYENGIADHILELAQDKNITDVIQISKQGKGKDADDRPEYKAKFEMVFSFNNDYPQQLYFHNSSNLEYGGSPQKAVRTGIVSVIDNYLKSNGKYNKGEKGITYVDVEDSLILECSSFSTVTSYENQTKKAITNKFVRELIQEAIKEELTIYFAENPMEAEKICLQVLVNMRARNKAEKTRINVKKVLGGQINIANRIKKFVDCRSKDNTKRELYIVEGDSALGSCKLGRNAEFQGVMPVRGKILNCLKSDYDKIFKSDIIVDLLKVLGCGVEITSKHNKDLHTFDINNLKWDKVIICTDADEDGYQIRTLILTMLFRLVPTLIEQGKVFIAETPLYEITIGTGRKAITKFAYSEAEKTAILEEHAGEKTKLQRSKGLGENTPEMMWETTMNPETRTLIQVTMEEAGMYSDIFDMFLGDDLEGRRSYISENMHEWI